MGVTLLAPLPPQYGLTGSGKTHTMEGDAALPGVMPQSFAHIFAALGARGASTTSLVRASYLEIYNEELRDLLSPPTGVPLELKEHPESGVHVRGLTSCVVRSPAELSDVLAAGRRNRATGATLMNATSSRSHAIFTVTVETSGGGGGGLEGAVGGPPATIRAGRLHMVDLAGSERQSKTGAAGARLREATKINLSLSALGNVISALADGGGRGGGGHIPYRDSKLTRLLQDSLGGNARTLMIAAVGPASEHSDESLSTLRYAARAKHIRNAPRVNEDPKDAMLREFQNEIARLRERLATEEAKGAAGGGRGLDADAAGSGSAGGAWDGAGAAAGGHDEALLSRVAEERAAHEARASAAEAEKRALAAEIATLQEKLLVGGGAVGAGAGASSARSEELLTAQREIEERRQKEAALARELEEANLMMEEQYATMAEELDAKTKKLAKLWDKLGRSQQEIQVSVGCGVGGCVGCCCGLPPTRTESGSHPSHPPSSPAGPH